MSTGLKWPAPPCHAPPHPWHSPPPKCSTPRGQHHAKARACMPATAARPPPRAHLVVLPLDEAAVRQHDKGAHVGGVQHVRAHKQLQAVRKALRAGQAAVGSREGGEWRRAPHQARLFEPATLPARRSCMGAGGLWLHWHRSEGIPVFELLLKWPHPACGQGAFGPACPRLKGRLACVPAQVPSWRVVGAHARAHTHAHKQAHAPAAHWWS